MTWITYSVSVLTKNLARIQHHLDTLSITQLKRSTKSSLRNKILSKQ